MCTAINFKAKDNYFGRTLDVEIEYPTSVVVCPRNFIFNENLKSHYAMIGMAMVFKDYPLFFDATNEYGLSMAGLNFPNNACYFDSVEGKNNLAVFELIPYILGKCKTVVEAKKEFSNINIINENFNNMPSTPLHWIVSDEDNSITIEQTKSGLKVFDNEIGVLTNNPAFDWHMINLNNYLNITAEEPTNRMLKGYNLEPYCKGMGGMGLPGDLSSASRFVRVAFAKSNALTYDTEEKNVNQFFHILNTVEQTTGLDKANNSYEQTLYTSCCNTSKGIYYYTTYFNREINVIDMNKTDLNSDKLSTFKLKTEPHINY